MATNEPFMLLIEQHGARMLLEALIKLRKTGKKTVWGEHEIDYMMYNIATHAGVQWTKKAVPEAYAICFPEGPPRLGGLHGKRTFGRESEAAKNEHR